MAKEIMGGSFRRIFVVKIVKLFVGSGAINQVDFSAKVDQEYRGKEKLIH